MGAGSLSVSDCVILSKSVAYVYCYFLGTNETGMILSST